MVVNLNITLIYHRIGTLENVSTVVNDHGIFITLALGVLLSEKWREWEKANEKETKKVGSRMEERGRKLRKRWEHGWVYRRWNQRKCDRERENIQIQINRAREREWASEIRKKRETKNKCERKETEGERIKLQKKRDG